jgi:hypothetical protein
MMQTCNDEHWQYMKKLKPAEAPCGKTFDDVDHSTICPHSYILSREERDQAYENACGTLGHRPIVDGACLCGKYLRRRVPRDTLET